MRAPRRPHSPARMTVPSATGANRWSAPLRLLHWFAVPLLAVQFAVSLFIMGDGTGAVSWLGFHVSLGALLALVIGARLVCRLFDRGPPGRRVLAQMGQALLYLLALGVSATGWLAYRPSPFAPRAVLFGVFDLPVLSSLRLAPWSVWHLWLVWLFLFLVAGHVAMAIYHVCIPGDPTMAAMSLRVPRRTRP